MCGINGIFAYNSAAGNPSEQELIATRDHMIARGPDGFGAWWSQDCRMALGHRRLAILDLSGRAAQPMVSESGRYVLTFNGEIYNYPELRTELEANGRRFRTTSDTEVLLHLFELFGEDMVHRLRGMFAFAIWDEHSRRLFLARDPYGIKPLYTSNDGWHFRFASQVKALLAGGQISREPDPAGVVGFHLWGAVPEPFTCYRAVSSLPAGHVQWVTDTGPLEAKRYVSIAAQFATSNVSGVSKEEAVSVVQAALRESVEAHMLADVEVGLFLSAGVDSSAMLGMMTDLSRKPIRALTLAFDEYQGTLEDESVVASTVATAFNAAHVIRRVSKAEFNRDLPSILDAMDQPSIDGVNVWFVAKAAREHELKVALSGLGGDELFGGYPSFRDVPLWHSWLRVPAAIPGLGVGIRQLTRATGVFSGRPKVRGLIEFGGSLAGAYFLRRGLFLPFELKTQLELRFVRDGLKRLRLIERLRESALQPDPGSSMRQVASLESVSYLRNQLLRDCDWAGMAHSLEIRTPLVDIALLQACAPHMGLFTGGQGKRIVADACRTPLPPVVVDRKKTGFIMPTVQWAMEAADARTTNTMSFDSRRWARYVFRHQIADSGGLSYT